MYCGLFFFEVGVGRLLKAAINDLVGIDEPDVVLIIAHEFSLHFKDLDLANFLKIVSHLVALHLSISLKLAILQQLKLVNVTLTPIVD